MKRACVCLAALVLAAAPAVCCAETTAIAVNVKSKDAKFVGHSMGGALVTIKDLHTGELLAQGVTHGSTGDTGRIMKTPHARGAALSDDGSARFTAELTLDRPRLLEIAAYGPLAQQQSANRASITQWVVPGKPITQGAAILLELPGFVVDVLSPPAHQKLRGVPQEIALSANVTLMCGCPVEPGGLWDAGRYEVTAQITKDGTAYATVPLAYAGSASQFAAMLTCPAPGTYEVLVYAYDPSNGNTGLDHTTFVIAE